MIIQKKRSVNRLNLGWKRRVESRITSRFLARTTRRPEVTFAKDELGLGLPALSGLICLLPLPN